MPSLFFLHALGASARAWDGVIARLGERYDCVALDLPGYGDRAAQGYADVAETVRWFADMVRARQPETWCVVGHSMGGKIATLTAAAARDGERELSGLAGVVLLAASPPAPEPMEEERRAAMLDWAAQGAIDAAHAAEFVDANTAATLPDPLRRQAMEDVRRADRQAWLGWLERGSREDWSAAAGRIAVPALIVAGGEDGDLGEQAQRTLNLPHYARARVEVVAGAKHLLPLEAPDAVAALIARHVDQAVAHALPPRFAALLASDRVSMRARATLLARHAGPDSEARGVLSTAQRRVLAALVAAVLPGAADAEDLARRLDVALAEGRGDGWRPADLPSDAPCWAMALDTLDRAGATDFAALDPADRARLLARLAEDGGEALAGGPLTPAQMRLWFAEARAEIARHWMALPTTMARIGYDGFAVGGDGVRQQGYVRTGADDPEPWQLDPDARR